MRKLNASALIYNWNGFAAVVADNANNVSIRKSGFKICNCGLKFLLVRERGRRQNHIGNDILFPILVNNVMVFVSFIVHRNGGFIPKKNNIFNRIERLHIKHGVQIGLNVADNDVYIVSNTVVDFTNASSSPVTRRFFDGKIVQAYIVHTFAAECECDAFLDGYCGFRKR